MVVVNTPKSAKDAETPKSRATLPVLKCGLNNCSFTCKQSKRMRDHKAEAHETSEESLMDGSVNASALGLDETTDSVQIIIDDNEPKSPVTVRRERIMAEAKLTIEGEKQKALDAQRKIMDILDGGDKAEVHEISTEEPLLDGSVYARTISDCKANEMVVHNTPKSAKEVKASKPRTPLPVLTCNVSNCSFTCKQGWHGLIHLDFIHPDLSG